MKLTDIPAKFNIPFANAVGGGYITYPLPEASQIAIAAGRASLTDGFPPVNWQPVGAGGTPPWGQDFNGILKQITLWNRWQSAGGLAPYDAAFATAIGGYPQGAIVKSTTAGGIWLCLTDDNINNPDVVSTGWRLIVWAPVRWRAYTTVNRNYTGLTQVVRFDAAVAGSDAGMVFGAGNNRFTASVAGWYQMSMSLLSSTGTNGFGGGLRLNGTTVIASATGTQITNYTNVPFAVSTLYYLAVNDYVEAYSASTGTSQVDGAPSSHFAGHLLSI